MGNFIISPEAFEDLHHIWDSIAIDNPEAADRVIDAAYRMCKNLGVHPELGRLRQFSKKELSGIRSFVITEFPSYIVFYCVVPGGVQIVRVLHGARDIERLFGE